MNQSDWEQIVAVLEARHQMRERCVADSRRIIQLSGKAIRAVHSRDMHSARELLTQADELHRQLIAEAAKNEWILHTGPLGEAEKELVESHCVVAMVGGSPLPRPDQLSCQTISYLHGVGEAASELRRYLLDETRKGNFETAEELFEQMQLVYDQLSLMHFPDGLTGGLRRVVDNLRAVLERTRADLSLTTSQAKLTKALENRDSGA
jgi:translin